MEETVSHYRILEELPRGGMGVVYKAQDLKLQREVALKFLPEMLSLDQQAVARLQREAYAASSLNHPNICTIYEIDECEGRHFIAMEFLYGKTLRELLDKGRLDLERLIDIGSQIADGLDAAHKKGIIHRDIKPANIFITDHGEPKVLDFGLAKILSSGKLSPDESTASAADLALTQPGTMMGTIAYMSPEQARGEEVDARSDIFSFGVVLYEMATGLRPFAGATSAVVFDAILHKEPVSILHLNPGLSPALDQIVRKALDKSPEERYQSAKELLVDLRRLKHAQELQPRKTRLARLRVPILVAVLVLLALLIPGNFSLFRGWMGFAPLGKEKIAIVLFTGMGDTAFAEALGRSISMDLASRLTQLKRFQDRVAVASSSEILNQKITTARGARQLLGVSLAITGNVNCQGHRVAVTMYLENARNLTQRDARSVDGQLADWDALRNSCVLKLAQMLQLKLDPDELKVFAAEEKQQPLMLASEAQIRLFMYRSDRLKDIDTAISLCREAIVADPQYAPAYATLSEAIYRKHRLTQENGLLDEGRTNAAQAIKLDNALPAAYVSRGLIYDASGEYERAIADFQQALRLEPANVNGLLGLARAYDHQNRLEDAEKTYREAVKLHPNHWPCPNEFGIYFFGHGQYAEAARQWEQVLKITPDNVWGYSNRGAAFLRMERWDEAVSDLQTAIRMAPDNVGALNNLGTAYLSLGRNADAAQAYLKASEIKRPDFVILGNIATAYSKIPGKSKEAEESFRRAAALAEERLNENPRDATALSRLATYYGSLRERSRAIEKIGQAVVLAPRDAEVCYRAVQVYESVGQREQALLWAGKALDLNFPKGRVEANPDLRALIADPRYAKIVLQHTK